MLQKTQISRDISTDLQKLISSPGYSSIYLLADSNTAKHCLPLVEQLFTNDKIIVVPAGEANKNLHSCGIIWEHLMKSGADKNSLLVNLGGGMITDLGGFAASVFKRGIHFAHVPTTLLAMVDASLGGKTGIDFQNHKNQLGTFTWPDMVICHLPFLDTLPQRELLSGYAEVLKHAWLSGGEFWVELQEIQVEIKTSIETINRAAALKLNMVEKDPLEKGERKKLNMGHTIGHAIESFSLENDKEPLLHGEAVAAGLRLEAAIAFKLDMLPEADYNALLKSLTVFPDYTLQQNALPRLLDFMLSDKKNHGNEITFSLPAGIGKCEIVSLKLEKVKELLNQILK